MTASAIRMIIFPLDSSTFNLNVDNDEDTYTIDFDHVPIDWNTVVLDPHILSLMFQQQVKNNLYRFDELANHCIEDGSLQCVKFNHIRSESLDVFTRDREAMLQNGFNVRTHAVVLIYRGEYYGHIYTWISPVNVDMCFAMGIRARVDNLFLDANRRLMNISHILLEGVRRFALGMGCTSISVPRPFPVMENILEQLGFEAETIDGPLVGESINMGGGEEQTDVHTLKGLYRPLTTRPLSFISIA
jgi:hypothetical protein